MFRQRPHGLPILRSHYVEFLDDYASSHGAPSRSAAVARAVALLRAHVLSDSYEQAWAEWETSEDASLWAAVTADGLDSS